jgi:hypothetical protein
MQPLKSLQAPPLDIAPQPPAGMSQYCVNADTVGNGVGAGRSPVGTRVRGAVGSSVGLEVGCGRLGEEEGVDEGLAVGS